MASGTGSGQRRRRLLLLAAVGPSAHGFVSTAAPNCACLTAARAQLPHIMSEKAGTLILLRHGSTEVPAGSTFLGWSDPDLNRQGVMQTQEAARAILEAGCECAEDKNRVTAACVHPDAALFLIA